MGKVYRCGELEEVVDWMEGDCLSLIRCLGLDTALHDVFLSSREFLVVRVLGKVSLAHQLEIFQLAALVEELVHWSFGREVLLHLFAIFFF